MLTAKDSETSETLPIYKPEFDWNFLNPKYWASWVFVALLAACAYMPRRMSKWLGVGLGKLFYSLNPKRRSIARRNINLCFPNLDQAAQNQLLLEHYKIYGRSIIDLSLVVFASEKKLSRLTKINGLSAFQDLVNSGRPIILFTPHVAGIDYGGILLSKYHPACSMMKALPNPLMNWLVCKGRTRYGLTLSLRDQGMRPVVRALKQNRIFYYIPDEDFGAKHSVFVPYFGIQTATITVLGRLAQLTNALVVPCYTRLRADNKGYEVDLGEALEEFPSGDRIDDAITMNDSLEEGIRKAPEQYFWTFKWFRTRPDGAPSIYD